MADGVFNIAKGRFVEKIEDVNAKCIVLLLKTAVADATLADFDTVALMLADGGVDEADFGNYARDEAITGTVTIDDGNEWVTVDIPDTTLASATAGNTLVKLIVAYEETAADSGRIPLTHHDFSVTTDGSDITAQVNAAGFVKAT